MAEATTHEAPTATPMSYAPGAFVWHELNTRDVAASEAFFTRLFGWTIQRMPMESFEYPMIHANGVAIGGIVDMNHMGVPKEVPSHFVGYVSVPSVDASADAAKQAGGQVVAGPMDIPGVGRFAVIVDPQGAVLSVFRSLQGDPDQTQMPKTGEFCWDELATSDVDAAVSFYQKVVGWTAGASPARMEGGVFMMGDKMEASYGGLPMPQAPTHWLAHVVVENLTASVQKAKDLGAKILMERMEIPFGTFAVAMDPQGAAFAMFEGKAS